MGFFSVDTYSLYQGIEKKKSLYSKIIKQNGKPLSKTDKTPSNRDIYEDLGTRNFDGETRPSTQEEKNNFIHWHEKQADESREKLKQDSGITSHKHDDLDECIHKILDKKTLSQLERYRKEFAHRLDSLKNLNRELENRQPQDIKEMLDTISEALNSYYKCFQDILAYTKSLHHRGITGLQYDSLSRLELADYILKKRKSKDSQDFST